MCRAQTVALIFFFLLMSPPLAAQDTPPAENRRLATLAGQLGSPIMERREAALAALAEAGEAAVPHLIGALSADENLSRSAAAREGSFVSF